jgi:hypothetical protein
MKSLARPSLQRAALSFHLLAWFSILTSALTPSLKAEEARSAPVSRVWSISPAASLVFGEIFADAPGSEDIAYGLRVGHVLHPGLRTVYSASALTGIQDFFFLNARADYFFGHDSRFAPFASAGAGLITGDTGSEFDFLFGAGLEVTLTDMLSVGEVAMMHLSPAQALTDREGNPFTVLESSITFRF